LPKIFDQHPVITWKLFELEINQDYSLTGSYIRVFNRYQGQWPWMEQSPSLCIISRS